MANAPIYTTFDSVKVRLTNKVQFQTSPEELLQGQLPDALLAQLISDAETMVEQDLRSRYKIPFQSASRGAYKNLPDHTQRALRTVVDWKSVMIILGTDFGLGTHVSADPYFKKLSDDYDLEIDRLLGRDKIGANDKIDRFKVSPPLDDLALAITNVEDAGYRGKVINTDGSTHGAEDYAKRHINDPSQSYIGRRGFGL